MWWIPVYISFMVLLVGIVFLLCYIYSKKEKNIDLKNSTSQDDIEKPDEDLDEDDGILDAGEEGHKRKNEKLFPHIMTDEDDTDFDKAIDDMIFIDLMDDD